MNLRRQFTFAGTLAAAMAAVAVPAVPSVDTVTMAQPGPSRLVNIDYTLSGADAVITLDIQTNANTSAGAYDPGWTSIGGEAIGNATGDVWKKVTNDGTTHQIKWRPDLSWPDHIIANGGARAVGTLQTELELQCADGQFVGVYLRQLDDGVGARTIQIGVEG